jgi:hypothetical protein
MAVGLGFPDAIAAQRMSIAQAFAGPPSPGRPPSAARPDRA